MLTPPMPAISNSDETESNTKLMLPSRAGENLAALERLLAEPTESVVEALRRLDGDVMLLGVSGKMGPSMARMIRRASEIAAIRRRVIGVSRFQNVEPITQLQTEGFDTIRCDLLDAEQIAGLPEVANVIYLAGMKFGTAGQEPRASAMNTLLPAAVCRKFRHSRIVAFSTGNIYALSACGEWRLARDGPARASRGEYAMSCLGRERLFEYFSGALELPVALIRLNYACDLRYGVLVDLAQRVWHDKPIDLTTGYFNIIWQGDANAMALQSILHTSSPPRVLNITGPELLRVRDICEQLGRIMGRTPNFLVRKRRQHC